MTLPRRLRSLVGTALAMVGLKKPAVALWLTVRRPVRIWHEVAIWRDYLQFRRRHPFLRQRVRGDVVPLGRVLIISLTDFVAQLKVESILAKALEFRGYEPVALTESRRAWARRYYRTFGFDRLLAFDRYLPSEIPVQTAREIDDLTESRPSFQSFTQFQFRNVDVGRQALATVLRGMHKGKLDFETPEVRRLMRGAMREGVAAVIAAERVLDEVRPSVALINDAQYSGVGALFESALNRHIPVVQWIGSQRDDAMALKRFDRRTSRLHPFSLSDETWELVSKLPWTPERERELLQDFTDRYVDGRWQSYYNRTYGALIDRSAAQKRLDLDPSRKTATIFAHILWDSTLFWGEDVFGDYQDWLIETVRAACENRDVNWLIKLHPGNTWKLKRDGLTGESVDRRVLRETFGELPDHIKLLGDADLNTYAVLGLTDYCLTVRGTIGIEAAALGIRVLTGGTGRYSGLGFTIDSSSPGEYLDRIRHIHKLPAPTPTEVESAKKYAHALFVLRPARFETFRQFNLPLARVGHPLDHNVTINARSLDDLRQAADLAAFADWVVDSSAADFLTVVPVTAAIHRG